jgi:nucleotide-binding universal stress UspA family protein
MEALLEAKELGSRCRSSQITIFNVYPSMRSLKYVQYESDFNKIEEQTIENSRKLLADAIKNFEDYPGEVNTIYKKGDPAEEILKLAEEGGYTTIIMGNQGLGKFSRALLGSVSNKVANHAKVNVLITK